jgi:chemotaxis methyl-accepting protein methylase
VPVKKPGGDSPAASDPRFESLLVHLKQSRGFDFSAYKRASLMRRVHIRMREAAVGDFTEYRSALDLDPKEFTRLFNTILINVTGFFRDGPAVWNYLAESVLPDIIAQSERTGRIRVWSAGCASGEEAYSITMLLAAALGPDGFRERVKILLLCRNCMMYFNADAQSRILAKFRYSLADGGVLFLGKAETLPAGATSFTPLDPKRRIFTRQARSRVVGTIDAPSDRDQGHCADAVAAPEE